MAKMSEHGGRGSFKHTNQSEYARVFPAVSLVRSADRSGTARASRRGGTRRQRDRQRTEPAVAAFEISAARVEGHGNLPGGEIARSKPAFGHGKAGQRSAGAAAIAA